VGRYGGRVDAWWETFRDLWLLVLVLGVGSVVVGWLRGRYKKD